MTGASYSDKGTPEPILTDTVGDVEHEDYTIGAEHPAPPPVEERTYPSPGKAWYCVFVLALAVLVNFLDRNILNLLAESIKRDLQLTEIETSLILGVAFTVFYSIFGLPVARLVDRGNRKKIMAAGIAIWSVMTAFCGLASSFWQLFIGRVGVGVGETTSGPSAYSLLSDYFPPQKLPKAIAGMNMGFVLGIGMASIFGGLLIGVIGDRSFTFPVVGELAGWQMVLISAGLPGVIVALLMLTVTEPPRHGQASKDSQPITEVFKFVWHNRAVYLPLFLGLAIRSAQMAAVGAWGVVFYIRTYGWTPDFIGPVTGVTMLISMPIGLFLGSWFGEHYWKKGYHDANMRVVVYSTMITIPFALAPLLPNPWMVVGLGLIAGIFNGMAAPVENAALQIVTPNKFRGQVTFLFLFTMNVIGFGLGPIILAAMTQYIFGEAGIRYSLVLTGVIFGPVATYIFWLGMKPYGKAVAAGGLEVQESDKAT